ncbi:MAG TPA: class I SAM-dependent methyltransferase [Candidatus Hydrogenedentes bacterium]|nr:class I SAM-dependent methyltransferase [Candidatus Hydrogenedentota bacterium]HNT86897.1 class I SAM-dependent methyltransferase [Candidatus Hydrogenedentota bacterium]
MTASGEAVCRFCSAPLRHTFVDLGMSPLCESFVESERLNEMEAFYPLHVWVCDRCFLVQLQEYVSPPAIFSHYAYFSSYSDTWLAHARAYVGIAIDRFSLTKNSHVVEIASNDGYLLQFFVERGIPVTGVEPAANVAEAARAKGIPTVVRFFGDNAARDLAADEKMADLIVGNNVLAHVPDINDFVAGIRRLLKPDGVITMEFPHLLRLVEGNQFDTIYHEHFSYLSFEVTRRIFEAHGLRLFDVEELPTHGGSLRIYGCHRDAGRFARHARVDRLLALERAHGMTGPDFYRSFAPQVAAAKRKLLELLIAAKQAGKSIAGYGAPGKGNTLLNYCGIRTDFLDYTVDRNPFKHGKYCPGTHIPILPVDKVRETRPDYLLILPWNLREEITRQMAYIREWGGRFIVPIPEAEVCP